MGTKLLKRLCFTGLSLTIFLFIVNNIGHAASIPPGTVKDTGAGAVSPVTVKPVPTDPSSAGTSKPIPTETITVNVLVLGGPNHDKRVKGVDVFLIIFNKSFISSNISGRQQCMTDDLGTCTIPAFEVQRTGPLKLMVGVWDKNLGVQGQLVFTIALGETDESVRLPVDPIPQPNYHHL